MAHGLQFPCVGSVATSRSRGVKIHWAVVAQNATGGAYLFVVELYAADTGESVFEKIKREYNSTTASSRNENWVSRLFTKIVVGQVEVQWVYNDAFMLHKNLADGANVETRDSKRLQAKRKGAHQERQRRPTFV